MAANWAATAPEAAPGRIGSLLLAFPPVAVLLLGRLDVIVWSMDGTCRAASSAVRAPGRRVVVGLMMCLPQSQSAETERREARDVR